MKKLFIFFAFVFLTVSCVHHYSGSNGEKTQMDAEKEFTEGLSKSDSTAMVSVAESFITKLIGGQTDEAVDMLYVLFENELYHKSREYNDELIQRFQLFNGCSYKLDYYSFSTQGNNDICYNLWSGDEGDGPVLKITLNPVLVDGLWYLTLKDGYQPSKVMNPDKQLHPLAPAPENITVHEYTKK